MADLVDSCSFASKNDQVAFRTYAFGGAGQSFACSADRTLDSIKVWLGAGTAGDGTVSIDVFSHTGTYGTNGVPDALLATSDAQNVTSITPDGEFSFTYSGANRISLVNGTKYFLIAKLTGTSGTGYLYLGIVNSSVVAGNYADGYAGAWSANASRDACFEVYGVAAAAVGGLSKHYYFS